MCALMACYAVHDICSQMISKQRSDRTPEQHLCCIKQEAELWSRCQRSPYLTRLEGVYQDDMYAYIVQERATGGDLKALIKVSGV